MPKPKKHHKAHRMRRNAAAAPARPLPRAIVLRQRAPTARAVAEQDARDLEAARKAAEEDTRGWRTIKTLGGAAATTVAGAYLARQDVLPPKIMTGAISALGAALALGAPNKTVRSIGLGAMAAAGGQLGFMLIDDELIRREDNKKKDDRPQLLSGSRPSAPAAPAKKPSNASDIPADALARAYERARMRMALASDEPN
jgi:hypothetical protein